MPTQNKLNIMQSTIRNTSTVRKVEVLTDKFKERRI